MSIRSWSKARLWVAYRLWAARERSAARVVARLLRTRTSVRPRTRLTPQRKVYLLKVWRARRSQAARMKRIFGAEIVRRKTVIVSRETVGYPATRAFQHVEWGNVPMVIHHTVTPASEDAVQAARRIDREHRARGYNGIGYHLLVHQDGEIVEGRPPEVVGAHAGTNEGNRWPGVALIGDYRYARVTPAQTAALNWIEKDYLPRFGAHVTRRVRHGDLYPTACPGPNAGPALG